MIERSLMFEALLGDTFFLKLNESADVTYFTYLFYYFVSLIDLISHENSDSSGMTKRPLPVLNFVIYFISSPNYVGVLISSKLIISINATY